MLGLTQQELRILKPLTTPAKIQNFLDTLAINFERGGDTCMSPRRVLQTKKAHCMEGAMLAALILKLHGKKPLIMDLKSGRGDDDHVVALSRSRGYWGAISKTNHAVLRYREPVYKTLRELALSYFHEYFLNNGRKTLRSFSEPLDLSRFDKWGWITSEKNLWYIPRYLDSIKHYPFAPRPILKKLRKADAIEIAAGKLVEWSRRGKRLFK